MSKNFRKVSSEHRRNLDTKDNISQEEANQNQKIYPQDIKNDTSIGET